MSNTFRKTALEKNMNCKLKFKGGVWLHFEPKFVTDCKAHKTPAILCIFIEFFMQIDQPTV